MAEQRRGIRLVDLLVAIPIIAIVIGAGVVFLLKAQDRSRHSQCIENLRKLGAATQRYDSQFGRVPPGWLGPLQSESAPKYDEVQNVSALTYLLPYLGQEDLYKDLQASSPAGYLELPKVHPAWFLDAALMRIASTRVDSFLCPAAPDMFRASDGVIVGVHFANDPKGVVLPPLHFLPKQDAAFATLGRTNYFGVAGLCGRGTNTNFPGVRFGMARFEGVFTNRSQMSGNLMTSADGTSNTLLFGEGTGGSHDWESESPGEKAPMQYGASWMGCGALPTGGGLAQHGDRSFWYQFSSAHEGVVNFCFADGAVRQLRISKSAAVLYPRPQIPEDAQADSTSPYWTLQELGGVRDAGMRNQDSIVIKDKP